MRELFYKIIYNGYINSVLLRMNKLVNTIFPGSIKLSPSGMISMPTEGARIIFYTNQTSYITQFIYWNGYKKFEYSIIFLDLIKKVESFYDIGANIGYFSFLAVSANKNIKVTCFEPSNGAWHYLKKNIEANNFIGNITAEKIALLDTEGEVDFYEVQNRKYKYLQYNLSGEASTAGTGHHPNFNKYSVTSTTLDKYVERNKVNKIDLIKIDTEGCEHLILKAAAYTIEKFQPIIICETLFEVIEDKLESIMKTHNYRFFNHDGDRLVEVYSISRTQDNGVRNCFFVPTSKIHLIEKYL